ncbi:MAG TPA: TonB-dependent receptor [Thermoanaerobaculia bacterium]|nr:TonB-dependent receptor [Thermoanaerobaculia bacterium]
MKRLTSIAALLLLLITVGAIAQEQTATIQGTATDASGAALPGVTVEALNTRGQRFTAETDRQGNYRIPSVPPGIYTVTGTLAGMKTATVRGLQVSLGTAPKADLKLGVGTVAQSITVTAEAPVVDVTSSATQSTIRSETFENLPIGRDFQSIVTLTPSASVEEKSGGSGTGIHYGGVAIDGTTAAESRYVLDGVDTTDPQTGTAGKRIVTDMVEEVQVKTAGYQAEFGGALGGVVNVISKTGTNDFRGTIGGYFLNSGWNGAARPTLEYNASATDFQETTFKKDKFNRVDPTFALGGPIVRDRLWFFAAYVPTYLSTTRTVNFRDANNAVYQTSNYDQTFRRQNITANVNGNIGSKFVFKAAANLSPYKTTNTLPLIQGRGNPDPVGYTGKDDKKDESAYSAYADFIPAQKWYLSARGGRFYTNYRQLGIPADTRVSFTGSNSVFDAPPALARPSGFSNIPTNSAVTFDKYTRDNLNFDVSWFPTFAGTHAFKAGIQQANLANDVASGEQNYLMNFRWNRGSRFGLPGRGQYGVLSVRQFGTFGKVTDKMTGLFLQDQWSVTDRLTLNPGIRAEKETIPSYNAGIIPGVQSNAIEFKYGDKLAPRLGLAYDVLGNNRWKVYGSAGDYYDVFKMELPRGSFGGDQWIDYNFALNTLDWTSVKCTGNPNRSTLTCGPGVEFLNKINLREASNDPNSASGTIDPNLKPMKSREFTIGTQHEISPLTALGVRYTRKRLLRAIEDIGASDPEDTTEAYCICNPGEGLARQEWYKRLGMWGPTANFYPGFPKARRDYDAVEFEFTKRFASRWSAHASYLWSRLYGNYSGLVNSDEDTGASQAARVAPNVSRWGDMPWAYFSATTGRMANGLLPNDRTHQIKFQANYAAPFGTQIGISEYVASGTPLTTEMEYRGVPFMATNRGDMGRTPWVDSTNLMIGHRFNLTGRYGLQVQLNVLNLFDRKTVIAREELWTGTETLDTDSITFPQFFAGFDAYKAAATAGIKQDPLYGHASAYQDPRSVQLEIKLSF